MNKPVAVLPDPISAGQEVWAETEILNSGCAEYKGNIYLGGRGPDGSIQDFVEQPVVIPPNGGRVTYKQKRTFSIVGKYTFTMGRVGENGSWQIIDNGAATRFSSLVVDTTCRTGYQLSVEQDLSVTPNQAASGQAVTARVMIINRGCAAYDGTIYLGGRGPGGEPDIQDFPGQKVRIEPNGGTVLYEQSRTFSTLGSYAFAMGRTDEQGNWQEIPAGAGKRTANLTLTSNCLPQPLVVTEALAANPTAANAGQSVTVSFTVKNTNPASCAPVVPRYLGVAVRGPGGDADNQDFGYAENIPIPSGQTFVYKNTKKFTAPGPYRIWIAAFGDGVWYTVATTEPANSGTFTVKAGPPTVTLTTKPDGGTIPVTPGPVTVTTTPLVVDGTVVPPAEPPTEIAITQPPVPTVATTTGSADPTFSGGKLTIVGSAGTENATSPGRTWDGNPGTSWATWRWNPASASFTLDLGQVSTLSGIKWMVLEANQTPQMTVSVSADGVTWTPVGSFGNLATTSSWYGTTATGDARYVRFSLTNPTRQFMLGKISEIEIWGTQPTLPGPETDQGTAQGGSADPQFSGQSLAIASSEGTSNATSSTRAWDGDAGTSWATWSDSPQLAFFTLDLGKPMTISGIKWMVLANGYSDWLEVSMSVDGQTWVPVGRFGNPGATSSWFGATASGNAQFIRFEFHNVAGSTMLGKISEVEVWGTPVTGTPTAAADGADKTPAVSGKTPAAAGKTPAGAVKTPASLGKTPAVAARPTGSPTKAATTARPSTANTPTPRPGATSATLRTPATAVKPTVRPTTQTASVPTKAAGPTEAAIAGSSADSGSQPAIVASGDQANVPTSVVEAPVSPTLVPTTPAPTEETLGDPTQTPTPIVFDGAASELITETPPPAVTDPEEPTVTPTVEAAAEIVTPTETAVPANDAPSAPPTPTPIVFDGSAPQDATETPIPNEPVAEGATETPDASEVAAEGPTATPTSEVPAVVESPTDTPVPADQGAPDASTPTAIVFDGSAPEVATETAAPEDVVVTPTETPVPADGSLYDVPTETPHPGGDGLAIDATETPADVVVPDTVSTETPVMAEGSLYDLPTETPGSPDGATVVELTEVSLDGVATSEAVTETEVVEVPTEAPTPAPTPLSIITVGDSEQSPDAYVAADFDPNTSWSVWPSLSPREIRLTLDLGQVQPVAAFDLDLDDRGLLPTAEVWLSEDGITWWNVTSFDARSAPSGLPVRVNMGYWTRFIALVVPHADTLGMPEIGGIQEIQVWAPVDGDPTPVRSLSEAGVPTTPEPVPTEVVPTEVVTVDPGTVNVPVETAAPEAPLPAETPVDTGGDGDPEVIAPEG